MGAEQEKAYEKTGSSPKEKPRLRCPVCGAKVYRNNMLRHSKTQKHLDAVYIMQDRFEIE